MMMQPKMNIWLWVLAFSLLSLGSNPLSGHSQSIQNNTTVDERNGYWVMEAPIPTPRQDNVVIACEGYLYVLGGYGSGGSSYRYDPASDSWTQLATMSPEIEYPADGCLGYNNGGEPLVVLLPDTSSTSPDVIMAYNIARNRWEARSVPPPLPSWGIWHPDIASDPAHNVCYITGGATYPGYGNLNTLYAYYPATNTARRLPSFTTWRAYHASWFLPQWGEQGYVCIAGGAGINVSDLDSTQCYDVAQGVWHTENADLGALPHKWRTMADALVVVNEVPQLWLLGGTVEPLKTTETAYYDPGQEKWITGPHLPYEVARMEADTLNNEIFVVGGDENSFNPTTYNQHHIQEPLPSCTDTPVFFDNFEGEQNWTPSGLDYLWHPEPQDGACGALVAPFPSADTAWYYGDEAYSCTYDTPEANWGYLTLNTTIPITGARYATIQFWSYEQTQCGDSGLDCHTDVRQLEASYDGGASWTYLWRGVRENNWYTVTATTHVDPGHSLRLRFNFTTYTSTSNDHLGWFIDNVEVTGCFEQPVQTWFEEDDPAITYSGVWNPYQCSQCSGGAQKYSRQRGAAAEFSFEGTGIRWYMTKASMLGKARVYLDGIDLGLVDLYSPTPQYQQVWEQSGLAPGAHTLRIEVSGKKNPRSNGRAITLDAFEVVP